MKPGTITELEMPVVGLKYRVSISTRNALALDVKRGGLRVYLEREPENTHDENAVKVMMDGEPYNGLHIGYVKKDIAAVLAPVLDSGIPVITAKLLAVDMQDGTGEIVVTLKTPVQAKKKVIKKKSPKKT
jgi:HIRAN domain